MPATINGAYSPIVIKRAGDVAIRRRTERRAAGYPGEDTLVGEIDYTYTVRPAIHHQETRMATLVVLSEGMEITFELNDGQNVIGRRPDCAISISHPATSGLHAIIHAEVGNYVL